MADEPEHPIEPTLRAWAQSRRLQAGAEFELHPVDRAQLHQEVQRAGGVGVDGASAGAPLWRALFPRLAFIGVLTILLLVAVVQWVPRRAASDGSFEVAQSEESSAPAAPAMRSAASEESDVAVLPPTRSVAEVELKSTLSDVAGKETARGRSAASATAPPGRALASPEPEPADELRPTASSDQAPAAGLLREQIQEPFASRYGLTVGASARRSLEEPEARAPRPAPAPSEAERPTVPDTPVLQLQPTELSAEPSYADMAFADAPGAAVEAWTPDWSASLVRKQVARRNFNAPPDVALRSFKVEQSGQLFRVLDADGSVYRGRVRADLSGAGPSAVRPVVSGDPMPSNGVSFLVSGTNLTSRQTLLFQGLIETGGVVRLQGQALLGEGDRIVVEAQGEQP